VALQRKPSSNSEIEILVAFMGIHANRNLWSPKLLQERKKDGGNITAIHGSGSESSHRRVLGHFRSHFIATLRPLATSKECRAIW
jgi:hypothetical protein